MSLMHTLKRLTLVGLVVATVSLTLLLNAKNQTQDIRPQASTSSENCSDDRADINCDGQIDLRDINLLLMEFDL